MRQKDMTKIKIDDKCDFFVIFMTLYNNYEIKCQNNEILSHIYEIKSH